MNRESLKKNRFVRTLAFHFRNWRESRSFTSGSGHSIVKRGVCVDSQIQIQGSNNFVLLDMDSVLFRSKIKVNGQNNRVILHPGAYLSGVELYIEDNNCTMEIGANTYIGHHSHLACTEDDSTLNIGSKLCSHHTCRFAQETVTPFLIWRAVASILLLQLRLATIAGWAKLAR